MIARVIGGSVLLALGQQACSLRVKSLGDVQWCVHCTPHVCACVQVRMLACMHVGLVLGRGGAVDSLLVYVDTGGYNRGNCILLL